MAEREPDDMAEREPPGPPPPQSEHHPAPMEVVHENNPTSNGGEMMGSAAMRPVFLGNLNHSYTSADVAEVFERPIQPPGAEYKPIPVDRIDLKRGYCFVFLKDARTEDDKATAERFVSDINGMKTNEIPAYRFYLFLRVHRTFVKKSTPLSFSTTTTTRPPPPSPPCFVCVLIDTIVFPLPATIDATETHTTSLRIFFFRGVPNVSNALRAEFARGDGRIKRKEDDRRKRITPSETLFVVNFHEETTKREDLRMLFEPYGELVRIEMKRNYAFVQFRTVQEATRAKEEVNGGKLDQSVLTVEFVAQQRGEPRG
eukprot:CAMPEP_0116869312 /NCGR_PEP_ID=MMETSP0418-20121206/27693_1 /TAXON_ID=1158023 /ORGANISM="Astrosyne radiata, Strain 13vi08-1A" /LENGTH=313 /DNA_ID=CAMNT_0004505401 /DNA_START=18 /DNA_END=957 /DNA_ORIENTATION=-